MRDEYDFSPEELRNAVRGRYAERFKEGANLVPIVPDVTSAVLDGRR